MHKASKITSQILKRLYHPPKHSHKGQNGRVLVIAGSEQYHGSVVLAATMAAKMVDLVYLATTEDNFKIIQKYKEKLAEFIYVPKKEIKKMILENKRSYKKVSQTKSHLKKYQAHHPIDSVLIGPGLLPDNSTRKLVSMVLKNCQATTVIVDAGALHTINLNLVGPNCILTPHSNEFRKLFKLSATAQNVKAISNKYPFVVVLKGYIDYVAQNGKLFSNTTGNQGLTKGGTGDVLAGIICALAANNSPLLAAQAGVCLNGRAGERLYLKYKHNYSASELIDEVRML